MLGPGDALIVVPKPDIETQLRGEPPLILKVARQHPIRRPHRGAAPELRPAPDTPVRSQGLDDASIVDSLECGIGEVTADFQDMLAEPAGNEMSERVLELRPPALAIDLVEVVSP